MIHVHISSEGKGKASKEKLGRHELCWTGRGLTLKARKPLSVLVI